MRERYNMFLAILLILFNVIAFGMEIYLVSIDGGRGGYGYILLFLLLFLHPTLISAILTIKSQANRKSKNILVFNILGLLYLMFLAVIFIK